MIDDFSMEFVLALNPLYAVPIAAVVACAIIVYAFGFKSPVQPPSFEGIEEEKKFGKKRKTKENQKVKPLQNGKLAGSGMNKAFNNVAANKKKEEKHNSVAGKQTSSEKSVGQSLNQAEKSEKKVNKKKSQSDKKDLSERKRHDSTSNEDINDDGWVQLISKKGRKNRKKDEANIPETTQTVKGQATKNIAVNKLEDIHSKEEHVKQVIEVEQNTTSSKAKKQIAPKHENIITNTKDESLKFDEIKGKLQKNAATECNSDVTNAKENIEENIDMLVKTEVGSGSEGKSKSKKKKKKSSEMNTQEINSVDDILKSTAEEFIESSSCQKVSNDVAITPLISTQDINEKPVEISSETKASNVAFDELAGLYPEAKEQRRKKRVRRDH